MHVSALPEMAAPASEPAFFEKLQEVQTPPDAKKTAPKAGASLSIPYSRVDILVRNGIAFTRFIQIYRNHSKERQGYAFSIPIRPATVVSQFTLWDQGKRYPAAIEERSKAEKVYSSVTGDEAPSMTEDPGLGRRNLNRFDLRIFPIHPGEDKQIELVFYEPLRVKNGKVTFPLSLRKLLESTDVRHPGVTSETNKITIDIEDTVPVTSVVSSLGVEAQKLSPNRWHIQGAPPSAQLTDSTLQFDLAVGAEPIFTPVSYTKNEERLFLLRVLHRETAEEAAARAAEVEKQRAKMLEATKDPEAFRRPKALPVEPSPNPPVFMAVWHAPTGDLTLASPPERMKLDVAGMTTFMQMDRRDRFHGSWRMAEGFHAGKEAVYLTSDELFPASQWMIALQLAQERAGINSGARPDRKLAPAPTTTPKAKQDFASLLSHLSTALDRDGCKTAYLFIDQLPATEFEALTKAIESHPQVPFLLASFGEVVPEAIKKLGNVDLYDLDNGWIKRTKFMGDTRVLSHADLGELAVMAAGIGGGSEYQELWRALPNLDPGLARFESSGPALTDLILHGDAMSELTTFEESYGQRVAPPAEPQLRVIWLSGKFAEPGSVAGSLRITEGAGAMLGMLGVFFPPPAPAQLKGNFELASNSTNQFVEAIHGSLLANQLVGKIRSLSPMRSRFPGEEPQGANKEKVAKLQSELVALSRKASFITGETSFIALPPELRKKYGIEDPKDFETGQLIAPQTGPGSLDVPEPPTILILALGLTLLFLATHRRMRQAS